MFIDKWEIVRENFVHGQLISSKNIFKVHHDSVLLGKKNIIFFWVQLWRANSLSVSASSSELPTLGNPLYLSQCLSAMLYIFLRYLSVVSFFCTNINIWVRRFMSKGSQAESKNQLENRLTERKPGNRDTVGRGEGEGKVSLSRMSE